MIRADGAFGVVPGAHRGLVDRLVAGEVQQLPSDHAVDQLLLKLGRLVIVR
ncbi:hypothetical protein [Actinoplanes aureus]|uniref:Uncharacterized protein n=1 Tax=Actinoplanes aureus TaxID=2792083 RepID=A0A931CF58_9ACTN|nr:hypothetical protein [Actinoplanes aureus]MBG0566392.1 hypothetical protein [Actinoplanes aureus]